MRHFFYQNDQIITLLISTDSFRQIVIKCNPLFPHSLKAYYCPDIVSLPKFNSNFHGSKNLVHVFSAYTSSSYISILVIGEIGEIILSFFLGCIIIMPSKNWTYLFLVFVALLSSFCCCYIYILISNSVIIFFSYACCLLYSLYFYYFCNTHIIPMCQSFLYIILGFLLCCRILYTVVEVFPINILTV